MIMIDKNLKRPLVASADQHLILTLLCGILRPLGDHRRNHVHRSKGKRSKRRRTKNKKDQDKAARSSTESLPTMPELFRHIRVGFNATTQLLQNLAHLTSLLASVPSGEAESTLERRVAAVFVCTSTLPSLLTSSIPTLVAAASAESPPESSIRLVALPKQAEVHLANALFQPRVGFLALLHDAPGAKALLNVVKDKTPSVDIPWLKLNLQTEYMPVNIKTA